MNKTADLYGTAYRLLETVREVDEHSERNHYIGHAARGLLSLRLLDTTTQLVQGADAPGYLEGRLDIVTNTRWLSDIVLTREMAVTPRWVELRRWVLAKDGTVRSLPNRGYGTGSERPQLREALPRPPTNVSVTGNYRAPEITRELQVFLDGALPIPYNTAMVPIDDEQTSRPEDDYLESHALKKAGKSGHNLHLC